MHCMHAHEPAALLPHFEVDGMGWRFLHRTLCFDRFSGGKDDVVPSAGCAPERVSLTMPSLQ